MQIHFKWALSALITLILLGACQNNRVEKSRDPLGESYKLIDRGEHSQAIRELQGLLGRDGRPEVRVALASAYAAQAGVRVGDYWGFVIGFEAPELLPGTFPQNSSIERLKKFAKQLRGEKGQREIKALGGLLEGVSVWEQYQERVEAIPIVSGAALTDLRQAVEVLSPVQTPGGHLYRAILNLILFKSYLIQSGGFWLELDTVVERIMDDEIEVLCQFDVGRLIGTLDPLVYHLLEAMNDLMVAYPENRRHLESARNLIQATYGMTRDAAEDLRKKRLCQ